MMLLLLMQVWMLARVAVPPVLLLLLLLLPGRSASPDISTNAFAKPCGARWPTTVSMAFPCAEGVCQLSLKACTTIRLLATTYQVRGQRGDRDAVAAAASTQRLRDGHAATGTNSSSGGGDIEGSHH